MYKIDWFDVDLSNRIRLTTCPIATITEAMVLAIEKIEKRFSLHDVTLIHSAGAAYAVSMGNVIIGYVRIVQG